MNVAVIGTGYVGLVTGVVLSEIGHNVICIDIDEKKVEMMKQGKSPIYEPGLEEMLVRNISKKRLSFTTKHKEAFEKSEIVFIAVGTPQSESGAADLKFIKQAAKDIAQHVVYDTVVVVKSTVPVGTNDIVENIIQEELKAPVRVEVVSNPEFLREGHAIHDTFHGDRIVIGSDVKKPGDKIEALFTPLNLPIVRTNRRSAEMIKYAANAFLAVKISYINQIANLCEKLDADVNAVAEGIGMDNRIGRAFLSAGLGYGGSCFPKDTEALAFLARENNINLNIVDAAIKANSEQHEIFIQKVIDKLGGNVEAKTFAILGLAFKPNTDDLREAPALKIIEKLLSLGANVKVYDPIVQHLDGFQPGELEHCQSIEECMDNVDATLLVTEWDEFIENDWKELKKYPNQPLLFDGRNILSIDKLVKFGWQVEGIGQAQKRQSVKVI
ncbi:UDP-glucose/GDP-mannose dehydrogenase family protein [Ureibacillus chungkukjangi]|uniref:UDP-glucose dehydrogenase family protein n=1 Tax=Ureibacillus chungkukjangi TaxID=1202712 RepID=UPI002040B8ED|nr:UDP-glucose/GDP-mannose dehydrogenase family protein [Ureibacillus chungkukjangi]MCM3389088.1 UDP-glucose/GDP-mannose dehydrogenase family protein [Ureibacillus chungkukjangi]